jgi:hypothetical protein
MQELQWKLCELIRIAFGFADSAWIASCGGETCKRPVLQYVSWCWKIRGSQGELYLSSSAMITLLILNTRPACVVTEALEVSPAVLAILAVVDADGADWRGRLAACRQQHPSWQGVPIYSACSRGWR